MAITATQVNKEFIFHVTGRFDFTCAQEFEDLYLPQKGEPFEFVLDLKHTEYVDSSGIGLLLRMKHLLGQKIESILIRNCNPIVRHQFKVSQFDQFFVFE